MWFAETQEAEENICCAAQGTGGDYLYFLPPWSGIYIYFFG